MQHQSTSKAPLNIIIVGAGLSGLSAAISCALAGHCVRVLESAKELAEVGAGLQITPNASRLFEKWGILETLQPKAAEPKFLQVRRYFDGKVLVNADDFGRRMRQKYNAPFWDLHRVDVQRALVGRAEALGVKIQLNAKVQDVNLEKPSLLLQDGQELFADLLVAADGIWSTCRQCFLATEGKLDSPIPTGDLAYRIVLKLEDVQDEELRDWISNPSVHIWVGPGVHAVAYSLRNGQMFNIVLLVPDNLPPDIARQPGSLEEMRAIFSTWDPILNRFLDQVKTVDKWKLMHRNELESWVNEPSNLVFVGDSCHPMLPYLAQGANISIEDGAVLGNVLAALQSKSQLPQALLLYQQLRKKRGEEVARETFAQRNDLHLPDGPQQQARDALMLSMLGEDINCKFPIRLHCPKVQPWLFGYNAHQETEKALENWPTLPSHPSSPLPN